MPAKKNSPKCPNCQKPVAKEDLVTCCDCGKTGCTECLEDRNGDEYCPECAAKFRDEDAEDEDDDWDCEEDEETDDEECGD